MSNATHDIDTVLIELERAEVAAHDAALDPMVREDALRGFVRRTAAPLVALLNELKILREQGAGDNTLHMASHRILVEGYSEKTAEEAFANALEKAGHFFSDEFDVSITLQQLIELPNGGHRATMEIHLTPFALKLKPHVKTNDIELKRFHQKDFDDLRRREYEMKRHLVYDHFAAINGALAASRIPEYMMIEVNDANLMNYMLEKEFFKAGHEHNEGPKPFIPHGPEPGMAPNGFTVRVKRSE